MYRHGIAAQTNKKSKRGFELAFFYFIGYNYSCYIP